MPARLEILVGRIERLKIDAIVNPANSALIAGGGADGAIRRAAGDELNRLLDTFGGLAEGAALATPAFRLPARRIIHTVAPIWFAPGEEAEKIARLASCYRECLFAAAREGCASIAFPAIGTGAFGWPKDLGCEIAVETVCEYLPDAPALTRVVFCCFTEEDAELYRDQLG